MLTRRSFLAVPSLALSASSQRAPSFRRRALIVGINTYELKNSGAGVGAGTQVVSAPTVKRLPMQGQARDRGLGNLEGAVNDAKLMREVLISLHGFDPADIVYLENQQGTADRILSEFKRHLVDVSASGDLAVFFYAGHGSQVSNNASDETDKLDETLVPSDYRSSGDLRDKELARLYRAVARKGVSLTVILDSCHSGGVSRGRPSGEGRSRFATPDSRTVNDPSDRDPLTGKQLPDPSELGVLILSAAREDQRAMEDRYEDSDHGAFTARLVQVLRSGSPNERVDRLFQRLEALFRADGRPQQPQVFGNTRLDRGLLGQPADSTAAVAVAVERVEQDKVILRAGAAIGLSAGCVLRSVGMAANRKELAVRVEITAVLSLARSAGKIAGSGSLKPGDLLFLEKWVPTSSRPLRFYLEQNGPTEEAIRKTGKEIESLRDEGRLTLMADEMSPPRINLPRPTHILSWQNSEWWVERAVTAAEPLSLGANSIHERLGALLPRGSRLLTQLPAYPSLGVDIRAGLKNLGVEIVTSPGDADYVLSGQSRNGELTYFWCLPDFFQFSVRDKQLPLFTDQFSSERDSAEFTSRLAKIHGWLTLPTPPAGIDAFPYRLTFETVGGGEARSGQEVRVADRYKIVLKADQRDLDRLNRHGGVAPRYIYVFTIGANGQASLLFPTESSSGNVFPREEKAPVRIEVSARPDDFRIDLPEGHDSYFMVTSAEAIPLALEVFQWKSVVNYQSSSSRGQIGGGLAALLRSAGTSRAGTPTQDVPTNWSLDHVSLVTVK